jgi:hypothetical protein
MSQSLLLTAVLIAHLAGGPTDKNIVEVKGVVLDPEGTPVGAAQVVATATQGIVYLDRIGTTETDHRGQFVLKLTPRGTVSLSASKTADYWLHSGDWENVLENPGTAPVVDLAGDLSEPIVVRLGSRGGKLVIETTDSEGSFWPSIVFINHCRSGSAVSSGWSPISTLFPISEHLLPEGVYCVGVASANGMYPITSTCEKIQVVTGQLHQVKLTIDPLRLTTEIIRPVEGCSPQSESVPKK